MPAKGKKRLEDALLVGREIASNGVEESLEKEEKKRIDNIEKFQCTNENGVFSVQISEDGSKAAVGLGSGSIQLYSLPKLERIRKLLAGSFVGLPITSVKFYPTTTKQLLFAAGADGSVSVWDLQTLTLSDSVDEPGNQISALDFTSDGLSFATAGKDKNVRVYDSETLQVKIKFPGVDLLEVESDEASSSESSHCQKILALRFHPEDKDVMLTGGWDHAIKVPPISTAEKLIVFELFISDPKINTSMAIWDLRTDGVVRTIRGPFVCGDGLDVLGDEILTGSWLAQKSLQVWHHGSGRLIEEVPFPVPDHQGEFLYCARFWDSNTILAGGSGSNDIKIIERNSKKVLGVIDGADRCVQAMDINRKSKQILLGTSGSVLKSALFIQPD